MSRFKIKKIAISRVNIDSAIESLNESIRTGEYGYICVTNARTTHLANHEEAYCQIQNNSLLTVPDGVPIVWIAHNLGYNEVNKVSGKDMMDAVFKISAKKRYSHYFFGSTSETILKLQKNLKRQYPELEIKGAVSPPFQPLESFDVNVIAKEINELKPTFFWCGLGAPKQERFNALLQPLLNSTICVGVGLAFEYFAGTVKRAPKWMRICGLEWVYRLIQQPRNIKRAVFPLLCIFIQVIKSKINGNRTK